MTSIFLFLALLNIIPVGRCFNYGSNSETLTPYIHRHGSYLNHRQIRDCHKLEYGSAPHELFPAHRPNTSVSFKIKRFVKEIGVYPRRTIRGHYVTVADPLTTLSVLEPDQVGGCNLSILQTVAATAQKANCRLAVNAGYFDTKRGTCYGNVVSDGRKAHDSQGVQNVHFGLTMDDQIFFGYLSEKEYNSGNFKQLVGGVIWILRNGTGFVNASKNLECEDSQETGSMNEFINILSARSIVGNDLEGNVVIVQVDGKSGVDGINLFELETLLKDLGLVNAINLDGGGSSTLVMNGVTMNYPYDTCPDDSFSCDRRVSSILCVHAPYCEPKDCHNHGTCLNGTCVCDKNWMPPTCSELICGPTNCSNNGVCLTKGCVCYPGYFGESCEKACMDGWFGSMCLQRCDCVHGETCDKTSGACTCMPGYTGKKCEKKCNHGYYGVDCRSSCLCESDCFCDHETGSCSVPQNSSIFLAAKCLAKSMIETEHLVKENADEKRKWYATMIVLGVITTVCLTSFILVLFYSCSCRCKSEQILGSKRGTRKFTKLPLKLPSGELSDSSSETEIFPMKPYPNSQLK